MKLAVRPTGGTAPEAPCRAPCNAPASGGGACRRLSPPKERQRRSRKRHSFLSRTRLRGQIEPWIFFCEIAGGKVTVIRLSLIEISLLSICVKSYHTAKVVYLQRSPSPHTPLSVEDRVESPLSAPPQFHTTVPHDSGYVLYRHTSLSRSVLLINSDLHRVPTP